LRLPRKTNKDDAEGSLLSICIVISGYEIQTGPGPGPGPDLGTGV